MVDPHPKIDEFSLLPSRCVDSTSITSTRFVSAGTMYMRMTYLHQPYYLYLFAMFSPFITANSQHTMKLLRTRKPMPSKTELV